MSPRADKSVMGYNGIRTQYGCKQRGLILAGEGSAVAQHTEQAERDELARAVVREIERCGFPREFGYVVTRELGGPWSLTRMLGYLRGVRPTSADDIADELLAILADRDRIVRQQQAEQSNAALTAFYNRPDREQ